MLASFELLVSCFARTTMGFYYAVAKGRKPGIYQSWEECKEQVHKFAGPVFKKFPSAQEAQEFIDSRTRLSNNGLSSVSKNLTHARANLSGDFVALGSNKLTNSRTKRVRDSTEETNETSVKVEKRTKTVAITSASSSNNHKPGKTMDYDMDAQGFVNVYTDGACSGNGYNGAKAGIGVWFGDGSPLNISEPVRGRATNNMAEIQAVTRAAEVSRQAGFTRLRIHTDSEFLIKCVTLWMPGWKRRNWRTASGNPVINKVELQEMEAALKCFDVQWVHVRGHQGVYGNERADQLAREGAERYRSY